MLIGQWSHGDANAAMRSGGWSEPVGYGEGPKHNISETGGVGLGYTDKVETNRKEVK